jgi:hypothetical protein
MNGNKAEVCGDSMETDDNFLTIYDKHDKVVARFKWAYMTGFVTN